MRQKWRKKRQIKRENKKGKNPKNHLGHGKGEKQTCKKGKEQGKAGGIFQKDIEHIDEGEKEQGM